MKKTITLDENIICQEYLEREIGIESMALKYHVGKKRIREILDRNNIPIKKKGKQNLKVETVVKDWRINKFPAVEGKHYVAIDRNNSFTTRDYENLAGVLTTYIKKEYNVEIPTLYFRRRYYMETGNYWWEQWFDIVLVDNCETKKCPYCDWETIDSDNKSGMFETHLLKRHNITKIEYLKEFPQDKEYFCGKNPRTNRQIEKNNDNFVVCKICGRKLGRIDNNHLKTHNITKEEYIRKFGCQEMICNQYHDLLSKNATIINSKMTYQRKSKSEKEIIKFIKKSGIDCRSDRRILNGKEIDIYIPQKKIGIEYNGNLWHSEFFGKKDKKYHLLKLEECNKKGVSLIHIYEDEYIKNKDLILNKIIHILGENKNKPKIYARKTIVKEISKCIANDFLTKYDIYGDTSSTLYYGCFYENKLIAVMSFKLFDRHSKTYQIIRFSSDYNYVCCGVGGKIVKHFIKEQKTKNIFVMLERRWLKSIDDNIFTKIGFVKTKINPPDYFYLDKRNNSRLRKSLFCKKRLNKKYGLSLKLTELEMTRKLGFDRIWNCGSVTYQYKDSDISIIKKPNGYWNNKERCIEEGKKYRNLREFGEKSYTAYNYARKNGWLKEINKHYDKTILYNSFYSKVHYVYVYEFPQEKVCYVGRTNDINRRHQQHMIDIKDTLYKYCQSNNVSFPLPKVLKEKLNAEESQYYEDYFVNFYKNNAWKCLNKSTTGIGKGSLGATCKWTYEKCKDEALKYKTITDFEKGNQSAYKSSVKNGWIKDFFEYAKKTDNFWDDYDNCRNAFLQCKNSRELIKRFGGCYNAIKRNNFNDLKYPSKRKNE